MTYFIQWSVSSPYSWHQYSIIWITHDNDAKIKSCNSPEAYWTMGQWGLGMMQVRACAPFLIKLTKHINALSIQSHCTTTDKQLGILRCGAGTKTVLEELGHLCSPDPLESGTSNLTRTHILLILKGSWISDDFMFIVVPCCSTAKRSTTMDGDFKVSRRRKGHFQEALPGIKSSW